MADEEKKSALEDLDERLYQRGFEAPKIEPGKFGKKTHEVSEQWKKEPPKEPILKPHMVKKILIGSSIFFVAAAAYAGYRLYFGPSSFSLNSVDISIHGPVSVAGGEEFSLDVVVENKSEVALESVSMLVEYPRGAYASADSQDELTRAREELKDIASGRKTERKLPLVLFGEENSEKEIVVTLEFRFEGSSASLEKTEIYPVRVSSSPVNLRVSMPEEVNSRQEFEISISLESNTSSMLSDMLLQVDYPPTFSFTSATLPPADGDDTWYIGDLAVSGKREMKIRGTIDGQEGDERVFRVYSGTLARDTQNVIGTIYSFVSESVVITRPFLGIDLLVGGDNAPEYTTQSKKAIRVDVLWKNNMPNRITDAEIIVKLVGPFNKFSVMASGGGFYQSVDDTIVWNKNTARNLDVIEPGEAGSVNFSFKSLPLVDALGDILKDPSIQIEILMKGRMISEANVPESMSTSVSKVINIESNLAIAPRALYYTGPFKNSGPLPPQPEQETTYTIVLTVTNTSNAISGGIVRTTLPTYIKWLGIVSPSNEDIVFNEVGGEVVWSVGDIPRGIGFTSAAREVAFQVAFLPSISQINKSPALTGEITLIGKDIFTGTIIQDKGARLTTQLSTDPYFSSQQAIVTP